MISKRKLKLLTNHQLHNYGGDACIIPGARGLESCVTSARLCPVLLCEGGELLQHLGLVLAQVGQQAGVTAEEQIVYC